MLSTRNYTRYEVKHATKILLRNCSGEGVEYIRGSFYKGKNLFSTENNFATSYFLCFH